MSVADSFSSCNKKILQDITAASGNIIINKEENPYDNLNKSLVMGNIEDTTKQPSQNLNARNSSNIVINKLQEIQNNENTQSAQSSMLEDTFHSITENSNDNSVVKDVCIQDTNTSNDNSSQELPENSIDSLNISFDVPAGFSENTILNETYEFNSANNSVGISNSEVVNNVKETALNLIKDICNESESNVQNIINTEFKNETPIKSCEIDKIKFQNVSKATPTKAITSIIESLEKFHIADTPDKSIKNKSAEYVLDGKSSVISGNEEIQTDREEECLSPEQMIYETDKSYVISANEDNNEITEEDIITRIINKAEENIMNENSFVITSSQETKDGKIEDNKNPDQIKDAIETCIVDAGNEAIKNDEIEDNKSLEQIADINATGNDSKEIASEENSFEITSSQETKAEKIEDKKNPDQITDAIETYFVIAGNEENKNEAIEDNKSVEQIADINDTGNDSKDIVLEENSFVITSSQETKDGKIEDNKKPDQIKDAIETYIVDAGNEAIKNDEIEDNKSLEQIADINATGNDLKDIVLEENSFVITSNQETKDGKIEDNKNPDQIKDAIETYLVIAGNEAIKNDGIEDNKSLEQIADINDTGNDSNEIVLEENSFVNTSSQETKDGKIEDKKNPDQITDAIDETYFVIAGNEAIKNDGIEDNKSVEQIADINDTGNDSKEIASEENSFEITSSQETKAEKIEDKKNPDQITDAIETYFVIAGNEENKNEAIEDNKSVEEIADINDTGNDSKDIVLEENSFVITSSQETKDGKIEDNKKPDQIKDAIETCIVDAGNEAIKNEAIEDNKSLEQIADINDTGNDSNEIVLEENSFVNTSSQETKDGKIEDKKNPDQITDAIDETYFVIAGNEAIKNDGIEDNKSVEQIADINDTGNDSKEIVLEENSFVIAKENKIELDIKSPEKITDVIKTINNVEKYILNENSFTISTSEENILQAGKYENLSDFSETASNEDLERKAMSENVENKYPEKMITESIEENTKNEDNTLEQVQISTLNENSNILNETITIINETQTGNNTFDANKHEENVFMADSHSEENNSQNMKDIVDNVEKKSTDELKKTDCKYEENSNKYLEGNDTFTTCVGVSFNQESIDTDNTMIITENYEKSNIFKSIDNFKSFENDVIISKKDNSDLNLENLINEHNNSHKETYGSENISCNTVIENLQKLDISNDTLDPPLSTINMDEKKSVKILDNLKSDEVQNELIQETILSEIVNTDSNKILLDSEIINIDKKSASISMDDLKQESITIEHINLNDIENIQSIFGKVIIENNIKENETVQNAIPESIALTEVDITENIKNSVTIENQELMTEATEILQNKDIIKEIIPAVKENVNDLAIIENKLQSDESWKENEIIQNTNITDFIEKIVPGLSSLTDINSIVEDKILISNESYSLQDKYNSENVQEETNKIMSEYLPLVTEIDEIVQNQEGTEITETDNKVKENLIEETITQECKSSNINPNDQELDNAIMLPEECLLDDIILLENVKVDFDIIDDKIIENENTQINFVEKTIGVNETIPESFLTDLVQNVQINLTKESNSENVSFKESLGNVQNDNILKHEDKKVHSNTDMESIISDAEFRIFMDKYNNKTPQKCIENIQLKIDCQSETSENNVQSIVDHIIRKDNLTEDVIDLPVTNKIETECALPINKDQKEFNIELDFENRVKSNENNETNNRKENVSFKIPDIPIVSTTKKDTLQKDKNLHEKLLKEENKEDTACSSDKNNTEYRTKVLEDFVSKIEEESSNPINDEEQFISGDFFKNPQDFDIFVNITNKLQEKNLGRQSKMSLLVQFDPLFEKRGVSSPVLKEKIISGITRAARMSQSPRSKKPLLQFDSEIKEEENLKQFEDVPFEIESDTKLSDNIQLFEGVESLISELDSKKIYKENVLLHKEFENANTKLLNELEHHLNSHNYRDNNDHYDFSNVILNIEKFLENFKEPITKADVMTLIEILKKVLLNLQTQYNIETQELLLKIQENGAASQSHERCQALQAKLEEAENNVETLLSALSESETVIVYLIQSQATVNNERKLAQQHLHNAESAFTDVHIKYENVKKIVEEMKINEQILKNAREELMHELQIQTMKIDTLKEHTNEQMETINKKFNEVRSNHETEVMKLTTKIRRMELHVQSLELQLQQKSNEAAELEQICDTLTTKLCNKPLS